MMNMLYEYCDLLKRTGKEMLVNFQKQNHPLDEGEMKYVDELLHAIKSVKATIAMEEAKEQTGEYNRGGYGASRGGAYDAYREGGYMDGGYQRRSRDSMGRYMSGNELTEQVRRAMESEKDPRKQEQYDQILNQLNRM